MSRAFQISMYLRGVRASLYKNCFSGSGWQGLWISQRPNHISVHNDLRGPAGDMCRPDRRYRNKLHVRKRAVLFGGRKIKEVKLEF